MDWIGLDLMSIIRIIKKEFHRIETKIEIEIEISYNNQKYVHFIYNKLIDNVYFLDRSK